MTLLHINQFQAAFPKVAPTLLPDFAARTAINCDVSAGTLTGRARSAPQDECFPITAQKFHKLQTTDWVSWSDPHAAFERSVLGSIQETVYTGVVTQEVDREIVCDEYADFISAGVSAEMHIHNITTNETRPIVSVTATRIIVGPSFSTAATEGAQYRVMYAAGDDPRTYYTAQADGDDYSRAWTTPLSVLRGSTTTETSLYTGFAYDVGAPPGGWAETLVDGTISDWALQHVYVGMHVRNESTAETVQIVGIRDDYILEFASPLSTPLQAGEAFSVVHIRAARAFHLGVPAPLRPPNLTHNWSDAGDGNGSEESLSNVTQYVYTYETARGEEGPPSRASADIPIYVQRDDAGTIIHWTAAITLNADSFVYPPANVATLNITKVNIYRATAGTHETAYQYLTTLPLARAVLSGFVDTHTDAEGLDFPIPDSALGHTLSTQDYDSPPLDLRGLTRFSDTVLVGFVKNEIFFSEPSAPHAWPKAYVITLEHDVVSLQALDGGLAVFTTGVPVVLIGEDPKRISVTPLGQERACTSPFGVCAYKNTAIFSSKIGLLRASISSVENLTTDLFTRTQWRALASDIHVTLDENLLYFSRPQALSGYCLDLDAPHIGVVSVEWPAQFTAFHKNYVVCTDLEAQEQRLYKLERDTEISTFLWRSKDFTLPPDTTMVCGRIMSTHPVRVVYYINEQPQRFSTGGFAKVIDSGEIFWLPATTSAERISISVQGSGTVQSIQLATSPQELV